MSSSAAVTVVVPTAGRVELTRSCLESVRVASGVEAVPVDIVVVDSSSPDDQERLTLICEQLDVELLPGPRSVSEKRNLGAEHALTQYVMFLDSDCVIAAGCLGAHLSRLTDETVDASQGKVLFQGPERLAFRAIRCSGLLNAFLPASGTPVQTACAGNLMVRRASFLDLRFDPRLGPPGLGGEDVDFGLRLLEAGGRFVGTPEAVVYHETITWNSFIADFRRFLAWGRSEAHLIERHPASSYLDMPSPVLVALALLLASAVSAIASPLALLAFPVGLITYGLIMAGVGAMKHRDDRLGGALGHWVFFILDAGRVIESILRTRPSSAFKRLRFAEDQVTQEWSDLVPIAWAEWLTTLTVIVFLWWSVK